LPAATMSKLENTLPKPKIELYSGKYFAACAVGGVIGASQSNFMPISKS
jgi:solute carrier family 25 (mitochondrial phosphate transporter), member 3